MKQWFWTMGLVFLLGLGGMVSGCTRETSSAAAENPILSVYADRPYLTGKATVVLQVKTAAAGSGSITLELNGSDAPLTAGNFADLVQKGFYNGLIFHRVVKDPQPFVVQGGDPKGNGTGGYVDPVTLRPRNIPLEIRLKDEKFPTYNTLFDVATLPKPIVLTHKRGALAMARSNAPDSASSQFYIGLVDLPTLDGRYAVFGSVQDGMDIVDKIAVGDRIESATLTRGADTLVMPKKS